MEKIRNLLKAFAESKRFNSVIYGFAILIVALLIFQAGVFVGFQKANFSYRWGDNYQKFFEMRGRDAGTPKGFDSVFRNGEQREGGRGFFEQVPMVPRDDFMGAHGVTGKIIDIKLPNIVVSDIDNTEKAVLLDDLTIIRQFKGDIKAADLKIGDNIIVVGAPNDNAEIVARMIRVMPAENAAVNNATNTNQ